MSKLRGWVAVMAVVGCVGLTAPTMTGCEAMRKVSGSQTHLTAVAAEREFAVAMYETIYRMHKSGVVDADTMDTARVVYSNWKIAHDNYVAVMALLAAGEGGDAFEVAQARAIHLARLTELYDRILEVTR